MWSRLPTGTRKMGPALPPFAESAELSGSRKVDYDTIEGDEEELPANASAGEYLAHHAAAPHNFFRRLVRDFGWRFTIQLLVMYLLVKGVMNSGIYLVTLPFCQKVLGVTGEDCQTLSAIAATPWALKGAIGVASDLVPLFGYHKLSFIILTACMGTVAVVLLAAVPIASAPVAAMLFAAANFQTATGDLLHEVNDIFMSACACAC